MGRPELVPTGECVSSHRASLCSRLTLGHCSSGFQAWHELPAANFLMSAGRPSERDCWLQAREADKGSCLRAEPPLSVGRSQRLITALQGLRMGPHIPAFPTTAPLWRRHPRKALSHRNTHLAGQRESTVRSVLVLLSSGPGWRSSTAQLRRSPVHH